MAKHFSSFLASLWGTISCCVLHAINRIMYVNQIWIFCVVFECYYFIFKFLPLLLPPPDIRLNFFRNWSRVGLSGGDGAARLVVEEIPGVDSTEYCLDSIDCSLGEFVLKNNQVVLIFHEIWTRMSFISVHIFAVFNSF